MKEMVVRLERLETTRAAHAHVLSGAPEEDAGKKIREWARRKGLHDEGLGARLFGRNTYPTEKPEPHGYEYFLTVGPDEKPEGDIDIKELPGGLYAVLRFKNLGRIGEAWGKLWKWIEESEYEHVGVRKSEHGWVNGYEEHLNWRENKPQSEWIFDLWVQLRE